MAEKDEEGDAPIKEIGLMKLPQEVNDCIYSSTKHLCLIDPTLMAGQFLKYRSRYLSVMNRGDFEKESLRKGLVQALHNGAWLVLDFQKIDLDLDSMFDKAHFPEAILSPEGMMLEENYMPLLRDSDNFTAKVTYEHSAAEVAQFDDRTKAHAPERVADIDSRFDPKDGFRFIVMTQCDSVPAALAKKMCVRRVAATAEEVKNNAGTWAGGSRRKVEKSKEQAKLDSDLLEVAFDGDLDEVKSLLEKKADPRAKDGRDNTPLSEAAVQGHLETVRALLDWKAPIGSDPNAQNSDGRTPCHRAAFQGHHETVQLLLERGSDPRIKTRSNEVPFDVASNDETSAVLSSWDVKRTDELLEEYRAAMAVEEESHVRNEEERIALERRRKMVKLVELAKAGDKDDLELELMDVEPAQIPSYRDDKGNTLLHVCAEYGRVECLAFLIEESKMNVNLRDAKGWTAIAVAAFKGQKKACQALIQRRADPLIENAYRKSAFDVAADDEIREVLKDESTATRASNSSTPAPEADADAADGPAPKAGAKAKAKAKGARAAGSGAAAAKQIAAEAKPKAKSKAKAKRR